MAVSSTVFFLHLGSSVTFSVLSYTFVHSFNSTLLTTVNLGAGNGKMSEILSYSREALKLIYNDVGWMCERQISLRGAKRKTVHVWQWGRGGESLRRLTFEKWPLSRILKGELEFRGNGKRAWQELEMAQSSIRSPKEFPHHWLKIRSSFWLKHWTLLPSACVNSSFFAHPESLKIYC